MPIDNVMFDIQFEGFHPEVETETNIKDALFRLVESCPYDSFVKANIISMGGRYLVEIFINHLTGKFCAFGEEMTLSAALSEAIQGIFRRLRVWRTHRFTGSQFERFGRKLDVLVVDDDRLAGRILETCFSSSNCQPITVDSGRMALEKAERQRFDLVVMDWLMPRLNGEQTLTALDRRMNRMGLSDESHKMPVLTYSSWDRSQIQFPKTKNLFQIGHLSKASSYQVLKKLTDDILRQVRESMTVLPHRAH
jgi:CheY-like chemotaxis protein